MTASLQKDERTDDLGRKGFRIIQHTGSFCFGIDAVLLAEFADISPQAKTADLGCGNGILPLLLKARDKGGHFTAVEIQPELAGLARRNMELNGLSDEVDVLEADLCQASEYLGKNGFDAVVANPPYFKAGSGLLNPASVKAIARHEVACTLEDVLRESAALLREGGSLFLVFRCWRMGEALALLPGTGLKARRLRIVHSFRGDSGELFLLEAKKGARDGLVVEAPCLIYEAPGVFSEEVRKACGAGAEEENRE